MDSSLRPTSRRQEDYYDDDDEDYEEDETGESSPAGSFDMELHSMTAKGIKHLCSELLEINKASQEDFQRKVHLAYLSFLRLFQEAADLEKDVGHLKQQAIAHRTLVQHLSNNLIYSSAAASSLIQGVDQNSMVHQPMDLDLDLDMGLGLDACSPSVVTIVDPLDVLLSEQRMEQALELLEMEGHELEKLHVDDAQAMASSMTALSARKARVADRFASLAGNPRTPHHELLRALSGLCRLGDSQRANHLLFKFYRSGGVDQKLMIRCPSQRRNYIKELARTVFSSIIQASRSFIVLHGQPSPELSRWVREEMEDLSVAFHEYVSSISEAEAAEGLVLTIEAANCALSYYYCSSSSMLGMIVLEEDFMAMIQPSMEEVLAMYAKHMKQVVRLLVSSDAWVLGRFLMSGIQRIPQEGTDEDYCLLTASGRKFVTLIQEVVEDVSPLLHLGMKSSVLQLLAGLFTEYLNSVLAVDVADQQQQYMWQLSFLINCTTLVSLFPIIARGVFKSNRLASSDEAPKELDSLILFIKEAAGQVWTQFCQKFIRDTMSILTAPGNKPPTTSIRHVVMMPCSAFQVVFLRVRQLSNMYGTILASKDGTMKKLLQELMEAIIMWLHDNLDPWINHAHNNSLLHQIQLDVHFLLEIAKFGVFSSDNITSSALDLLSKAEEKVSSLEQIPPSSDGDIPAKAWATDAAKRAVQVLLAAGIKSSSSQEETSVESEDVFDAGGVDISTSAQESDDEEINDSVAGSSQTLDSSSNEHADSLALGSDERSIDDFISIEDDGMLPESPLGSTQVLASENHKLLTIDVLGDSAEGNSSELGGPDDASTEATPRDSQEDEDEDDESTLPGLLQDKMNRISATSEQSSGGSRRRRGAAADSKGSGGSRKKRGDNRPRWQ